MTDSVIGAAIALNEWAKWAITHDHMIAGAGFSDLITLGSAVLAGLLTIATLAGTIYGAKWKVTAQNAIATAAIWEENAKAERDRANRSQADKERLLLALDEHRETIAALRALPNLETLYTILEDHERRAQERHDATAAALAAMTARLTERTP